MKLLMTIVIDLMNQCVFAGSTHTEIRQFWLKLGYQFNTTIHSQVADLALYNLIKFNIKPSVYWGNICTLYQIKFIPKSWTDSTCPVGSGPRIRTDFGWNDSSSPWHEIKVEKWTSHLNFSYIIMHLQSSNIPYALFSVRSGSNCYIDIDCSYKVHYGPDVMNQSVPFKSILV